MKPLFFSQVAGALLLASLTFFGCKEDVPMPAPTTGEFTLHLDNGANAQAPAGGLAFSSLVLGTKTYYNANGDDFTVDVFKYYVSNVALLKADNTAYYVPDSYFLVDQSKPATLDLAFKNVPVGDYTQISFVVGVDSTRTKAGNFTGVLNSDNNMFWNMNGPEFINLKLEGHSSKSSTGGLVFHLAGFKHSTTNTIRTVTLPFITATSPANLLVRADHSPEVHMRVDIGKLFDGPNPAGVANPPFMNPVNFATLNGTMAPLIPATTSAKLANNLAAGMFSVNHIHAD